MKIAKHLMLVRINKTLQSKKRSMIGSILLHPDYVYMTRNLQFGVITQIGETAAENYPMARIGYEVTFHHTIEDGDYRILETDPESGDEYLYLDASDTNENYEIYGFFSPDGELLPSAHYVWLAPDVTRIKRRLASQYLHLETDIGDDWDDMERIQTKIDQLKENYELLYPSLNATRYNDFYLEAQRRTEIVNELNKIHDECFMLSRLMHKRKLGIGRVIAINSELARIYPELRVGVQVVCDLPLYPLDIFNDIDPGNSAQFLLVRSMDIVAYADGDVALSL